MDRGILIKPAQFAEQFIIDAILDGRYPPGSQLPAERALSEEIGVTRATLRETLQRLSRDGWISVQHGKATLVCDYLKDGGLAILSTLALYAEKLPRTLTLNLLDVRADLFAAISRLSCRNGKSALREMLLRAEDLPDDPDSFLRFDWALQLEMVRLSGNPVYSFIFNDFDRIFNMLGSRYFSLQSARERSREFYRDFLKAIEEGEERTSVVVEDAMRRVAMTWKNELL